MLFPDPLFSFLSSSVKTKSKVVALCAVAFTPAEKFTLPTDRA
jgi:hypothetical protein